MMERQGHDNPILLYRLSNQFLVDMYGQKETKMLNFIGHNQSKLGNKNTHTLEAQGMKETDNFRRLVRSLVVFPPIFTGWPRYLHERNQDAMTYVRHCQCPDLLITFTCNLKWM